MRSAINGAPRDKTAPGVPDLLGKWHLALAIASDNKLSRGDVAVAIHILDHLNSAKGYAWPSLPTLAREANLARSSVAESIQRLENAGYIVRAGGGKGRPNRYTIRSAPVRPTEGLDQSATPDGSGRAEQTGVVRPTGPKPLNTHVAPSEVGIDVVSPPGDRPSLEAPALTSAGAPEGFEQFWNAYPKREGRKSAIAEFERATRQGIRPELIVQKAQQYAIAKAGIDSRWIKMPANWLKGEGWLEDPQPPKPKAPRPGRDESGRDSTVVAKAKSARPGGEKPPVKSLRCPEAPMPIGARIAVGDRYGNKRKGAIAGYVLSKDGFISERKDLAVKERHHLDSYIVRYADGVEETVAPEEVTSLGAEKMTRYEEIFHNRESHALIGRLWAGADRKLLHGELGTGPVATLAPPSPSAIEAGHVLFDPVTKEVFAELTLGTAQPDSTPVKPPTLKRSASKGKSQPSFPPKVGSTVVFSGQTHQVTGIRWRHKTEGNMKSDESPGDGYTPYACFLKHEKTGATLEVSLNQLKRTT